MEIKNQPTFTSKIVFVNNRKWYDYLAEKGYGKNVWGNEVDLGERLHTFGVSTCVAGNLMGKKACSLFHMSRPEDDEIDLILKHADMLTKSDTPTGIVVTGGISPWYLSAYHFKKVMNALSQLNQKTSVISRQKDTGYTNLLCDAPSDIIILSHANAEKKGIKNLADLKDVYEKVHIADGDELLFGEQHLP